MSLSVVIPVFNDTSALAELMQRLYRVSDQQGIKTELLLVDDGSTEATWENLKHLKGAYPERKIILLRLAKNSGQHNATLCGLMQAEGDTLITMDADLQHPPEAIPALLSYLQQQGIDLVYGSAQQGQPWLRRLSSHIFQLLTQEIGKPSIKGSAFRVMKRDLANHLADKTQTPFTVIDSTLQKKAKGMAALTVAHHIRQHGKSSYTWTRLIVMAIHIVTSTPQFFRLLLLMAACTASLGAILLIWALMTSHMTEHANRGIALLSGGFLMLITCQWLRWQLRTASLKPRYTLQEKIE